MTADFWPNQWVERTGRSRSGQCQLRRQRRLITVAHLDRLMRTPHPHLLCLLLFAASLSGCVSDISHDSRYPTDYKVGAVYRLKQPVFADKADLTIFGTYSGLTL